MHGVFGTTYTTFIMFDNIREGLPNDIGIRLVGSTIIFFFTLIIALWMIPEFLRFVWTHSDSPVISKKHVIIKRTLCSILFTFGLIISVEELGVKDRVVWTIIGSTLGLGLSFSVQSVVKHILSGIALLLIKQPQLGNYIDLKASGIQVEGYIEDVGLMYSTIRSRPTCSIKRKKSPYEMTHNFDDNVETYIVPNGLLTDSIIKLHP